MLEVSSIFVVIIPKNYKNCVKLFQQDHFRRYKHDYETQIRMNIGKFQLKGLINFSKHWFNPFK